MKPKFKETIPYFLLDNEVQIGEEEGISGIISDPDGSISLLVQLLDGNHTFDQVVKKIRQKYPAITEKEIEEAISDLDQEKYLENSSFTTETLTPYLLERYKANLNYFSLYTNLSSSKYRIQEKINTCQVSLLGLGGLGRQILYHLAALGFHHIKAIDFDKLELSNFNRKLLYSELDIGQLKTKLAVKRIMQFNKNVNLKVTNKKIESPLDVAEHIKGTDYVVCVADRPTLHIHNWVNEAGVEKGVPMIFGGVLNTRGQFFSVIPKPTGCVRCHTEHIYSSSPRARFQRSYMESVNFQHKNAAISPNIAILAGIIVNELLKIVTDITPPVSLGNGPDKNQAARAPYVLSSSSQE